jgi:hypothetical protein
MRASRSYLSVLSFISLLAVLVFSSPAQAQSEKPVVRAVMFWMESCGHCHYIMDDVLPPLQDQYGEQLEFLLIELMTIEDTDLLYQMAESYGIPKNNVSVPLLFIGDRALSGSQQIPRELPGLIEAFLSAGGIDFPQAPGLEAFIMEAGANDDDDSCLLQEPCPDEVEALNNGKSEAYIPMVVRTSEETSEEERQTFPIVPALTGAGLGMAAFVLYNYRKNRHQNRTNGN